MTVDQSLFDQTFEQVRAKLLGAGDNLQLLNPYMDWWWPTAPTGQIAPQAFNLVNTVPMWSAVGEYKPGTSDFYNSYVQVLQHVDPSVPPAQKQAWTNAHDNLIAAQNQWQNDQTAAYRAWTVATTNLPPGVPAPDYQTWFTSSGWAKTLQTDALQVAKAQEVLSQVTGQQSPELTAALAASALPADKNAVKPGFTTMDQGDGTLVPVPVFSIGKSGQDWVAQLSQGGGNETTISVSQSKSSNSMAKSWAGGSASIGNPFWAVDVGGSWQKLNIDESDQSVEATISMTSTFVPVTPGQWYNGGYMKTLAGQNSFFPPWTAQGGSSPVFGKGGLLPLEVTGLIACYQPSFTITMSANSFSQAQQQFNASAGVRIGPFRFGGSGGHSSDTVTKSASNGVLTGKSTATYPFIIGVTVAMPGLDGVATESVAKSRTPEAV